VLAVLIWSTWPSSALWLVGVLVGISMFLQRHDAADAVDGRASHGCVMAVYRRVGVICEVLVRPPDKQRVPLNASPRFAGCQPRPHLLARSMRFTVFALDYDGTIAQGGVLDPEVRRAIADARERGITVAIVTGRILNDLRRVAGDLSIRGRRRRGERGRCRVP